MQALRKEIRELGRAVYLLLTQVQEPGMAGGAEMTELKHWAVRLVEAERVIAQQQDRLEHLEQENARLREANAQLKKYEHLWAGLHQAE